MFHPQPCLLGKGEKQAKAVPLMRFPSPAPPFCSEELSGLKAAPRHVWLVYLKLPWAAFHPFMLQFVMQEESELPDLIQAHSREAPGSAPVETQPAHRTFLEFILEILSWSRYKGGKSPSFHRLLHRIQALQLDSPWQPQKLTCKEIFSSEGASSCTDSVPPSLPSRRGTTNFSICILIVNISTGNEFLCKQELDSLLDRISRNNLHGTTPITSESKIHLALGNGGLEPQPAQLSLKSAAPWGLLLIQSLFQIYLFESTSPNNLFLKKLTCHSVL